MIFFLIPWTDSFVDSVYRPHVIFKLQTEKEMSMYRCKCMYVHKREMQVFQLISIFHWNLLDELLLWQIVSDEFSFGWIVA